MERRLVDTKPFEFSPRVPLQLGRESISNSTVAISELIKNAYDADAESVHLDFRLDDPESAALLIEDTGQGMSRQVLIDNWLRIGTENKLHEKRSKKKKRVLTGAKGLGRLGIDRLCRKLSLYTKTEGESKATLLEIDWSRFEDTNQALSEIKHGIYEVDLPFNDHFGTLEWHEGSSGTRMVLEGLKDDWDENFLEKLEKELRLLVSPYQSKNEFSIKLKTSFNGLMAEKSVSSSEILKTARWRVHASVDSDGKITVHYQNNIRNHEIVQESIAWADWMQNEGESPLFGPVEFEFHFLVQDTERLKKFKLRRASFREFMDRNMGVRIYRDHFRVRPYGEPTGRGDWLDFGLRRSMSPGGISQSGWKIGPNQIVGSVLISREANAILNDQANREGLLENDAFYQLKSFLLSVVERFEHKAVEDAKEQKAKQDSSDALLEERSNVRKKISKAEEKVNTNLSKPRKGQMTIADVISPEDEAVQEFKQYQELIKHEVEITDRAFEALLKRNRELEEKIEEQKNTMSNLASIGILTVSFGHEVRQHSALALNASRGVNQKIKKLEGPGKDKITELSNVVIESAKYVDNFSKFAIANIKPDKRRRKKVNVADTFTYVFNMFEKTLSKMNITAIVNKESSDVDYEVYAFEIDWESIAVNLMTNSTWAIEKTVNRDNPCIVVEIAADKDNIIVNYKDSGIGLSLGTEESIFQPMISGKKDRFGNSVGTGMGLAIIKSHVEENMNGKISAIAKSELGGAEFVISVPKSRRK